MNRGIGKLLVNRLSSLTWIDKLAGVVQEFTRTTATEAGKTIQNFPVYCDSPSDVCGEKEMRAIVPDAKTRCMVYFEDNGIIFLKRDSTGTYWTSRLMLVGWLNTDYFENTSNCSCAGVIVQAILSKLPQNPYNEGNYIMVQHRVVNQLPKTNSIFSKYSYPDTKIQFLQKPYDYFALNIETDFKLNRNCIDQVVPKEKDPC